MDLKEEPHFFLPIRRGAVLLLDKWNKEGLESAQCNTHLVFSLTHNPIH
jgi:hypothetical protein